MSEIIGIGEGSGGVGGLAVLVDGHRGGQRADQAVGFIDIIGRGVAAGVCLGHRIVARAVVGGGAGEVGLGAVELTAGVHGPRLGFNHIAVAVVGVGEAVAELVGARCGDPVLVAAGFNIAFIEVFVRLALGVRGLGQLVGVVVGIGLVALGVILGGLKVAVAARQP